MFVLAFSSSQFVIIRQNPSVMLFIMLQVAFYKNV